MRFTSISYIKENFSLDACFMNSKTFISVYIALL